MLQRALVLTLLYLLTAQAAALPVFERQANEGVCSSMVTKTVYVTALADSTSSTSTLVDDGLPTDLPGAGRGRVNVGLSETTTTSSSKGGYPGQKPPASSSSSTRAGEPKPANATPAPGAGDGHSNAVYFANWGIYDDASKNKKGFLPSQLPAGNVNRVLYSFMAISPDGSLNVTDPNADLDKVFPGGSSGPNNANGCVGEMFRLKKTHRNMKVILSVGGWTYSLAGQFQVVMSDTGRKNFAKSAVKFIADWGFDGVDIDWEYPKDKAEGSAFVALLKEVRGALDAYAAKSAPGYHFLLTAAVPADPKKCEPLDLKGMDAYLDSWNVMTYDYAGSWDQTSGHQANLNPGGDASTPFSTEAAIGAYLKAGISPKKIQLGLPLYGRAFEGTDGPGKPYTGVGPGGIEKGVFLYKDLPRQGGKETWDEKIGASWSFDAAKKEMVSYDTPEAAKKKAAWLLQKGLGGAFFWDASGDKTGSDSLVSILAGAMGNIESGQNLLSYPESKYDNIKNGGGA